MPSICLSGVKMPYMVMGWRKPVFVLEMLVPNLISL